MPGIHIRFCPVITDKTTPKVVFWMSEVFLTHKIFFKNTFMILYVHITCVLIISHSLKTLRMENNKKLNFVCNKILLFSNFHEMIAASISMLSTSGIFHFVKNWTHQDVVFLAGILLPPAKKKKWSRSHYIIWGNKQVRLLAWLTTLIKKEYGSLNAKTNLTLYVLMNHWCTQGV